MLKCKDVRNELQAFLGDEIDEAQKGEMNHHIENCQACSQALRQLQRLSEVLKVWEAPEPSPLLWDKLERRIRTHESIRASVFTYPRIKGIAFRFTEVAAIVAVTLSVSHWLHKPPPAVSDHSATINFYLREHQDVAAQVVSFEPSPPPAVRADVHRHDILYYEFFDDPYEFPRPGIIVRGSSSRPPVIAPQAPAISNGHTLTLSEARKVANFDLVSPPRLHPGYMLDQIRRIDGRDALHLLYTDGIHTVSLFEQPLDGQRGLEPEDFREYAVYYNQRQAGGTILAWRDESLSYVLIGNADMSQLMNMAQSISAAK